MKKLICLAMIASFGFLASGCATIVHGTTTRLSFDSVPEGATVKVDNQTAVTPVDVTIKNNANRTVEFSKDGYKPSVMYLDQVMSGWIWGNILSFGIIGIAIDVISGSAYKIEPKKINTTLEPKEPLQVHP